MHVLRLLMAVCIVPVSLSVTVDTSPPSTDDVFRPHPGVKVKTKLCMRCRQYIDAGHETDKFAQQQGAALNDAIALGIKTQARDAALEELRAKKSAATGDPMFGTDPNDASRVAMDRALEECVSMGKSEAAAAACLDTVRGERVQVPNARYPDGDHWVEKRVPNARTDPRGMAPDPRLPFVPPDPNEPGDLTFATPPFTHVDSLLFESADAALLELKAEQKQSVRTHSRTDSQHGGSARHNMASTSSDTAFTHGRLDGGTPPLSDALFHLPPAPAQKSIGQMVFLAELDLCVNEGSRQFVFSLFRGVVGSSGDIECTDIP